MSELVDGILAYVGATTSLLQKGENTAGGETADKTPDQPSQTEGVSAVQTDARKFANAVFARGMAKIPAEMLAMGDMYDMTQALTRISRLYDLKREDFYKEATRELEIRKTRLAYKQSIAVSAVHASEQPKEAQTRE